MIRPDVLIFPTIILYFVSLSREIAKAIPWRNRKVAYKEERLSAINRKQASFEPTAASPPPLPVLQEVQICF